MRRGGPLYKDVFSQCRKTLESILHRLSPRGHLALSYQKSDQQCWSVFQSEFLCNRMHVQPSVLPLNYSHPPTKTVVGAQDGPYFLRQNTRSYAGHTQIDRVAVVALSGPISLHHHQIWKLPVPILLTLSPGRLTLEFFLHLRTTQACDPCFEGEGPHLPTASAGRKKV